MKLLAMKRFVSVYAQVSAFVSSACCHGWLQDRQTDNACLFYMANERTKSYNN